jgi:ubiquinone/menaquinone biosynthesis C-methylase UbiE
MQATLHNAAVEGVSDRVDVETGDARALPMRDASFDAVVSSLAIHNIPDAEGRAQAIREAVRVLKPGGQIAIQDIMHTGQYMKVLRECGMDDVRRTNLQLRIFPPSRIVRAEKV